jgi:glycosyltransferase involved in cell wall biosynthesis
MNILNLSSSNLCNICTNLSDGINKYTEHDCRSVSMKPVVPYNCDIDILWRDNKELVDHLLDDCDILHLNSWYFRGYKRDHPVNIFRFIPFPFMSVFNTFYKKLNYNRKLLQGLPAIEDVWWYWYMQYINKSKVKDKKVLLHYHGGDLRRVMSESNKRFIKKHRLKAVTSIPDLLPYLDNSEWLPIPVPTANELYRPPSKRDDSIIKIVHTPSEREVKKTCVFIKAVDALKQKYDIELMLIENLPYKECLKLKREAHISFDNIEFGSYAGCSIEAFCHEQPSLVYLNEVSLEQINIVSNEIGIEAPFINVGGPKQPSVEFLNKVATGQAQNVVTEEDYQSVYTNLKQLIDDDSLRKEIGKRGRRWVRKVHDEEVVAEKIVKIYESLAVYN